MEGKWSHKPWTVKIRGALIRIIWDDDASLWAATSKDVPGLVLKDTDFRRLESRVDEAIRELRTVIT